MASEPIPEPLINQDLDAKREPEFPASRARISDNGEALNAVSSSVRPDRELPPGTAKPQLNHAAEAIGTALGRMVNRAREVSGPSDKAGPAWKETAQRKVEQAKEKVSTTLNEVQASAAVSYEQAKERVNATAIDTKQRTVEVMREARQRARHISYEYPVQVIAGSAAAGFLVGVVLRIWRSSRYE